jgi:hypothetical protein
VARGDCWGGREPACCTSDWVDVGGRFNVDGVLSNKVLVPPSSLALELEEETGWVFDTI